MNTPHNHLGNLPHLSLAALFAVAMTVVCTPVVSAQTQAATSLSTAPSSANSTAASEPAWGQLSPQEQAALKPLASSWSSLPAAQKRKWITASKDFGKLSPAEQANVHSRMTEWSHLSPQQRAAARLNFAQHKELTDGLTPEQKKAQWQAYQQLSAEEKRKLAENANRPAVTGAATATKPQPTLRKEPAPEFGTAKVLAKAQSSAVASSASAPAGKIAVAPHLQQQGSLLPGAPSTQADSKH